MKNKLNFKNILISVMLIIIVSLVLIPYSKNAFDEKHMNVNNIMEHIEELSSIEYEGRLAGSLGNKKSLQYISEYFEDLGISPAGTNGQYTQPFSVLVPKIDSEPILKLMASNDAKDLDFVMYEDFSVLLSPNGGGIDFTGEYVVLGSDYLRVESSLIKDKIVVIECNRVTQEIVSHIMAAGGKGILTSTDSISFNTQYQYVKTKSLNVSGKTGDSIFLGYITKDVYRTLEKSNSKKLRIKVDIEFPIVETANFLAKIEGSSLDNDVLIISANIDGLGMGVKGNVFPGATNSASGLGIMMEIARVMQLQETLPFKTVIFAGWNGQKQEQSGSNYYINNVSYPLDKTILIHLDSIGNKSLAELGIISDPVDGIIIRQKIVKYALDSDVRLLQGSSGYGILTQFSDKFVPSMMIFDSESQMDSYDDNYDNVDINAIGEVSSVLQSYLKRDVYKDVKMDYLNLAERIVLSILFLGALTSFLIGKIYAQHPILRLGHHTLENVYYSTPIILLRKFYANVLPYFLALFMLIVIANIDLNSNAKMINGHLESNSSLWLIFKRSILYLRGIFNPNTYQSSAVRETLDVVYDASKLSLVLVSSALILSTITGIFRGMLEGYRSKKSKFGSFANLLVFSIPEVFIVLIVLYMYSKFAKQFPDLRDLLPLKDFILPLITLSVIPSIYISRMTLIVIQEEMVKDYIKNEKAKGFSRRKIIFKELMPVVVFKILDIMPTVVTMLFSNMIVVEYLFNQKGILYYLIYLYNRQDISRFVPLALVLGVIYILFTKGFQLLAKAINPLKRKEVS